MEIWSKISKINIPDRKFMDLASKTVRTIHRLEVSRKWQWRSCNPHRRVWIHPFSWRLAIEWSTSVKISSANDTAFATVVALPTSLSFNVRNVPCKYTGRHKYQGKWVEEASCLLNLKHTSPTVFTLRSSATSALIFADTQTIADFFEEVALLSFETVEKPKPPENEFPEWKIWLCTKHFYSPCLYIVAKYRVSECKSEINIWGFSSKTVVKFHDG